MRNDLQWDLKNWHAMHGAPDVELYDFGDGSTAMPMMNSDGSWLTTSVCFIIVRGEGKPNLDKPNTSGLTYLGSGFFFYGVEIKLGTSRAELFEMLDSAKAHLLAGVKDHGKQQMDAAGV